MKLLTYMWKNGICSLIPLPVPKAWESGAHWNSADHLPLFKEATGRGGGVLLLSTSCGSCRGWLMTIQAPNGKENGKCFPAYKFCLSLPTQETGRQALRWHRAHLPRMREQWETGGRKRPGAEPQWLLSQSVLPSCHSQEGAGTTGFPHGDPTLARQIKHS